MKKTIATIATIGVIGAGIYGTIPSQEERTINDLIEKAEKSKQADGKYTHFERAKSGDIEYQIDEYLKPDGQTGYILKMFEEKNGLKYTKTIATGPDKEDWEKDWIIIGGEIKTATTATTTK